MSENTKPNDGGPAFPVMHPYTHKGISLRDRFAETAMQAMIQCSPEPVLNLKLMAVHAYAMADAMLAERSK